MAPLKKKREQIDSIDAQLLVLFNKRAKLVDQIKLIKSKHKLTTYDPGRETQIIATLTSLNPGPLSNKEITQIFKGLLAFYRKRQRS